MSNLITGGRRSAVEIIRQILSVCADGGANKTCIMYNSNLSYDQLRKYISLLTTQELIHRDEKGRFQITSQGRRTLRQVSNVIKTLVELRKDLEPAGIALV